MAGLDFIVFGVGRSGTTAVANYLNAVETIHCGLELFPPFLDHSQLRVPDSFLNGPIVKNTTVNGKISFDALSATPNTITTIGNKTPDYYYRLGELLQEIDQPKAILCYRDIRKVAQSYSMRAAQENDGWPVGRTGIFACLDVALLLISLDSVSESNIFVIPHLALQTDWLKTMSGAAAFLTGHEKPVFVERDIAIINSTKLRNQNTRKPDLTALEQEMLALIQPTGVNDFLVRDKTFMLSEVKQYIRSAVEKLNNDGLLADMIKIAKSLEDEEPAKIFRQWYRHYVKVNQIWRNARASMAHRNFEG